MSLAALFDRLEATRRELIVYTHDPESPALERFDARNADVERRAIPEWTPGEFVVVRDDGTFRGAFPVAEVRRMLTAPVPDPWGLDDLPADHRALFDLLGETVFEGFVPRALLVASREVEEHAWRVGTGTLCVGFQSPAAFEDQRAVYERLLAETDLDVHTYAESAPDDVPSQVTFHAEPSPAVRRNWFVAFDGSGDETRACAVVGHQRSADRYAGFWTFDPETVEAVFDAVPTGP